MEFNFFAEVGGPFLQLFTVAFVALVPLRIVVMLIR